MNRAAAPLARHRRAPLSEILSAAPARGAIARAGRRRPEALADFAPTAFAATTFAPDAAHAPAFAPTQFVERRREPRVASARVPAMAAAPRPWSPLPPAAGRGTGAAGGGAGGDDPRDAGPSTGFAVAVEGAGRGGLVPALERVLDRVTPAPIGTLLALVVVVSLAMAVISALLPLVDLG